MIALGLSSPGQLVCTYSGYQQSGYLKFELVVPGVVAEFFFEGGLYFNLRGSLQEPCGSTPILLQKGEFEIKRN